jgi:O-acetyl-ADP-ribose deacetylase
MQLEVVSGDITTIAADAIVNAANTSLRGGGGVDGAIHAAGGPAILEQCIQRFPDGLPAGGAGWTLAGHLPAKWVIHVVGPNWRAGVRDRNLLASCYRNALAVAHQLRAESVAFPLISAGSYGWPLDDAAAIAVSTVLATHCAAGQVLLVAYNREVEQALTKAQSRFVVPA